jgi:hypothetical protein
MHSAASCCSLSRLASLRRRFELGRRGPEPRTPSAGRPRRDSRKAASAGWVYGAIVSVDRFFASELESPERLGVTLVYPLVGTSFSNRSQSSGSPLPRSQNSRHARRGHIQYLQQRSNDRPLGHQTERQACSIFNGIVPQRAGSSNGRSP